LDVPKSMPQARAGDAFFMSFGFQLKKRPRSVCQCGTDSKAGYLLIRKLWP
jgi:hypothetical protein